MAKIIDRLFGRSAAPDPKMPSRGGGRVTLGEIATRELAENVSTLTGLLPNPDPVLKKMGKDIETYRELLSDEHLGSVVDTRKDGVRDLEWGIDRGKAKSRQTKAIDEMFKALDIYQIITEILDAPLFGYQPLELIWTERDGLIWLENIVGKPQEWFAYNAQNEPRFLARNFPSLDGMALPPMKFIIPRHDPRYTNPYGFPVLSRCFWSVTFSKGGIKFAVTFAEKHGMPWVFGKYPDELSQDKINEMRDGLESMVQDALVLMPQSAEGQIVQSGQTGSSDIFDKLITKMETRISKAVLGHGAAADATTGRLGNEERANETQWGRAASDKKMVEKVFNQAIQWIHELNFSDGEPPVFAFYEEEDVDQDLATRDQSLYALGWRPTADYMIKTYGMEEGDFEILEGSRLRDLVGGAQSVVELVKAYEAGQISREGGMATAIVMYKVSEEEAVRMFIKKDEPEPPPPAPNADLPPVGTSPEGPPPEGDAPPAEGAPFAEPSEPVTDQAGKAAGNGKITRGMVDPILGMLQKTGDYEQALDAIAKLYPDLDTNQMEEVLTGMMFVSDVLGRAKAQRETNG